MNEKDEAREKPEQDETRQSGQEPEPVSSEIDAGIAELRAMQESGEHLDQTIEEAREAVQAAREADSMRVTGMQQRDADEQGPQASG